MLRLEGLDTRDTSHPLDYPTAMSLPVDPVENLAVLIRCPSVTPSEGGALSALEAMLGAMDFRVERPVFTEPGTPDVENLYAVRSAAGRHLMFAGHTDVVPAGDEADWKHPPFAAFVSDGELYGRGAVDMKGGIACFVAALARHLQAGGGLGGSVSLLVTGDEEGPAVNGTAKLLEWAAARGERWDAAIVGEPTNPDLIGDTIKVGRRGSVSGAVTVRGTQGHVAYPQLADNPLRGVLALCACLMDPPFDAGSERFQPTNLEITSIDTGNTAANVIPAKASFSFNVRFNDHWTAERIQAEIRRRLDEAGSLLRPGRVGPVAFELVWRDRPSPVFLTHDDRLIDTLAAAIHAEAGRRPALSTSGGTSDARFIKDYCPVVEFGLVGKTMHMVDERVALADLELLTCIYRRFLESWFG